MHLTEYATNSSSGADRDVPDAVEVAKQASISVSHIEDTAAATDHAAPPAVIPNPVNGVNGVAYGFDYPEEAAQTEYKILPQHHSKPGKLRVACIGAGASGKCPPTSELSPERKLMCCLCDRHMSRLQDGADAAARVLGVDALREE
jgi:hypothetical protein